jgi:catechol 2,3-dioxygenase-like lactoylglutathione lyase family enzyme
MSSINVSSQTMKLEVLVLPVSDVDQAKGFYETLGLATGCRFCYQ